MAPSTREGLMRHVAEVAKKLRFDKVLDQRELAFRTAAHIDGGQAGPRHVRPCAWCGAPVEQGHLVAYRCCSWQCALSWGEDEAARSAYR